MAVLCSDLHLSHRPPSCRITEPDWYERMESYLTEVGCIASNCKAPVVIAGDIFDKWQNPAELVNWAISVFLGFPEVQWYAIPGQHDLAYHRKEDIRKTSYWTLHQAEAIKHIGKFEVHEDLMMWGFGWGDELQPLEAHCHESFFQLAVCHQYIWNNKQTKHPEALPEQKASKLGKALQGYDAAVFGDNHKAFTTTINGINVVNCGGFMRRRVDEVGNAPAVYLLHRDGTILPVELETPSEDIFVVPDDGTPLGQSDIDTKELVEIISQQVDAAEGFIDSVNRLLDSETLLPSVKLILQELLDE
jgi:predicted phosphodiesterase